MGESQIVRLVLYTDGGCRGNPGPGAWAAVSYTEYAQQENEVKTIEISGSAAQTTNNRMELQGVIEGLRSLPVHYPRIFQISSGSELEIAVYTDSQYVQNGITGWIHNWKRNAWRTSAKKPVKNQDLWQTLDSAVAEVQQYGRLRWYWVKGHAGNYYNERCDALVRQNFPCSAC